MQTEITIRFHDAATRACFTTDILTEAERQALNGVVGGFYFATERSAFSFMASIAAADYHISDFESIEFKAA